MGKLPHPASHDVNIAFFPPSFILLQITIMVIHRGKGGESPRYWYVCSKLICSGNDDPIVIDSDSSEDMREIVQRALSTPRAAEGSLSRSEE